MIDGQNNFHVDKMPGPIDENETLETMMVAVTDEDENHSYQISGIRSSKFFWPHNYPLSLLDASSIIDHSNRITRHLTK